MCAQTRPRFILSSERVFWGMEFELMLTPREKSPLLENFPGGGSNPRRCGQQAQTLPTSYSGPHTTYVSLITSIFEENFYQQKTGPASLYLDQQQANLQ